MPVYRIILKDAASGEFRDMAAAADSEDEATESALTKEAKHVNFVLDPSEVATFEQKLRDGTLSGRERAQLLSHRQEAAYKIKKVKAI